jgi:hypothetical protein
MAVDLGRDGLGDLVAIVPDDRLRRGDGVVQALAARQHVLDHPAVLVGRHGQRARAIAALVAQVLQRREIGLVQVGESGHLDGRAVARPGLPERLRRERDDRRAGKAEHGQEHGLDAEILRGVEHGVL